MKCPWCEDKTEDLDILNKENVSEHLMLVANKIGHVHIHGPFEQPLVMKNLITAILNECRKKGLRYKLVEDTEPIIDVPVIPIKEERSKS